MIKRLLFLDGEILPASESFLENLAPGMLTGRGVFETMRAYHGKIFLLEKHLKRLFFGLKKLNIKRPCSRKRIQDYLEMTLKSNKLKNSRIRLTVWRSGSRVRVSVIVWPYASYGKNQLRKGFRAHIVLFRKAHRKNFSIKSIDYLPFLAAYRDAKTKGFDEALLLDERGFLVEGSRSNLFLMKNGILYTPSLSCGCLKGITRQAVLDLGRLSGMAVRQTRLRLSDLFRADEAFLTNSLIEIMPLTKVQNQKIGKGTMGSATEKLLCAYRKKVQQEV